MFICPYFVGKSARNHGDSRGTSSKDTTCNYCGFVSKTQMALKKHILRNHREEDKKRKEFERGLADSDLFAAISSQW